MTRDEKIFLIEHMPNSVAALYYYCQHKIPVGIATIERAKQEGPEYFTPLGELDPFFESRGWLGIAYRWMKRQARWYWWRLKCKLGFGPWGRFRHRKPLKCPRCGERMERGILNYIEHTNNCKA